MQLVTPVILTYNEEVNIRRVIARLNSFDTIIVVDSYSSDDTVNIIKSFSNVVLHQRKFDDHTTQWNFGISKVNTKWVLSLDSDYILSNDFIEELNNFDRSGDEVAYSISFKYCINGQPLRGTILPPRVALFNKDYSTYIQDGHTQMLKTNGRVGQFKNVIFHDDRKPLDHWLWAQKRYADLEREKLLSVSSKDLSLADRIRLKIIPAPFIILIYCLVLKGCVFDGKKGWYYAFQRMYFEILLSLKLMEAKLGLWKLDEIS